MQHDNGESFSVDSDVWLCALDLALRSGWVPSGVESAENDDPADALDYVPPSGQRVLDEDASALASCLNDALQSVPDQEVPLQGKVFGTTNTLEMLRVVHGGGRIPHEDLPAAAEILSGSPKDEAGALAHFMSEGGFTLSLARRAGV